MGVDRIRTHGARGDCCTHSPLFHDAVDYTCFSVRHTRKLALKGEGAIGSTRQLSSLPIFTCCSARERLCNRRQLETAGIFDYS
jgi:hypothetical protein